MIFVNTENEHVSFSYYVLTGVRKKYKNTVKQH